MDYFSEELLFLGVGMLFFVLIFGFFIVIVVRSRSRLDIEKDKEPLYTSTGGGRMGWLNYRGPFINLRIYDAFVVVSSFQTIVLRYDEIERVDIKKWMGAVADRVQIVHHKADAPGTIIIGTINPTQAKEIIDAHLPQRGQRP
ncbi:MAG: hypothetical protein KDJ52_26320 [Anaerolineae bacterium]|nr:hypothetical protein [Anaerolineae bacterium]